MSVKVEGMKYALEKLDAEVQSIQGATQAAFWEGGLLIINQSLKLTPVDTSNLRGSAYIRNAETSLRPAPSNTGVDGSIPGDALPAIGVEIGYHANYAAYVHENVEQKLQGEKRTSGTGKGEYWGTGEPKFLEKVVMRNLDLIPELVRARTRMDEEKSI